MPDESRSVQQRLIAVADGRLRGDIAPLLIEAAERLADLPDVLALVQKLAALGSCMTEPEKCGFSSGPYCQEHGTGEAAELVYQARALLARMNATGAEPSVPPAP